MAGESRMRVRITPATYLKITHHCLHCGMPAHHHNGKTCTTQLVRILELIRTRHGLS
jgi:hypothetical protein